MIRYATQTGSVYEVDRDACRIRRVSGTHPPTERQGIDGEWKQYHALIEDGPGGGLVIAWTATGEGTITSRVVSRSEVPA